MCMSGPSLLIESTDSMICIVWCNVIETHLFKCSVYIGCGTADLPSQVFIFHPTLIAIHYYTVLCFRIRYSILELVNVLKLLYNKLLHV